MKDRYSTFLLALSVGVIVLFVSLALKNRGEVHMENPMQVGNYTAICVDGVQYWRAGNSLAPRINPANFKYMRCNTTDATIMPVDGTMPVCKDGVLYDVTGKALPSIRPCETINVDK